MGGKSEDAEQIALFDWAAIAVKQYPELRWLHSIPNGANKSPRQRLIFQRTGLKSGVADICLPVARKGFMGLYVEMKGWDKNGKPGQPSKNQLEFGEFVTEQGYLFQVCWGFEAARSAIEGYLK